MTEETKAKLDVVLKALYESISFKSGGSPDLVKLKSLFVDGARLIRADKENIAQMSVDDFIQNYKGRIDNGEIKEFSEFEISRKTDNFGRIMQVFSTYGTDFKTAEGRLTMRGINSIQLIEVDNEWKVATILWYPENEDTKIPEKYIN